MGKIKGFLFAVRHREILMIWAKREQGITKNRSYELRLSTTIIRNSYFFVYLSDKLQFSGRRMPAA